MEWSLICFWLIFIFVNDSMFTMGQIFVVMTLSVISIPAFIGALCMTVLTCVIEFGWALIWRFQSMIIKRKDDDIYALENEVANLQRELDLRRRIFCTRHIENRAC